MCDLFLHNGVTVVRVNGYFAYFVQYCLRSWLVGRPLPKSCSCPKGSCYPFYPGFTTFVHHLQHAFHQRSQHDSVLSMSFCPLPIGAKEPSAASVQVYVQPLYKLDDCTGLLRFLTNTRVLCTALGCCICVVRSFEDVTLFFDNKSVLRSIFFRSRIKLHCTKWLVPEINVVHHMSRS